MQMSARTIVQLFRIPLRFIESFGAHFSNELWRLRRVPRIDTLKCSFNALFIVTASHIRPKPVIEIAPKLFFPFLLFFRLFLSGLDLRLNPAGFGNKIMAL